MESSSHLLLFQNGLLSLCSLDVLEPFTVKFEASLLEYGNILICAVSHAALSNGLRAVFRDLGVANLDARVVLSLVLTDAALGMR